jgi:hypothetical protein
LFAEPLEGKPEQQGKETGRPLEGELGGGAYARHIGSA